MPAKKASPRDRNSNEPSLWGRKGGGTDYKTTMSCSLHNPLIPDFQFDPERFGRPLCEVPLFQTATISSTLAKDHKPAFEPSFKIMPCQYARSIETAEPEPPRKSSGSKRKYKSPEGWRSYHFLSLRAGTQSTQGVGSYNVMRVLPCNRDAEMEIWTIGTSYPLQRLWIAVR
ncbi:GATA zinc finger domain-containing protein [Fusarium mundagurra]|uniref:GATA zinc finger domain-containing protein n=1 Tax=Fusarium mundagurra TaxID=1567541 RepID=A0A8H6DPD6_9HYPO|nr:GATA zinc finger domain-containing protein [Fusarium mundagurra]